MEGLFPFATALGLVLLLELGDKTQLATVSLAARHPWPHVLAGAVLGLVLVTGAGALLGAILAVALSAWMTAIQAGGGLLFLAFGAVVLLRREETPEVRPHRNALVEAFVFNAVAELGDKTQLAVIFLAATHAAPLSVFLGGSLALALVAVTSVAVGTGLARLIQGPWLRRLSAGLFLAVGAYLILDALLL